MKLHARGDPCLTEWLEKTNKYVSHDIQNELLKVIPLFVLWDISCSIHESTFHSILLNLVLVLQPMLSVSGHETSLDIFVDYKETGASHGSGLAICNAQNQRSKVVGSLRITGFKYRIQIQYCAGVKHDQ